MTASEFVPKPSNEILADIRAGKDSFRHITTAEKISRSMMELSSTKASTVIKWGWKCFDSMLGGIYGGKIYVIGAESGTGKSTFVNQVARNVTKQGIRVVKYSLEDRMEDAGKEELYFSVNRMLGQLGKPQYEWCHFVNNEYGDPDSKFFDPDFEKYLRKAADVLSQSSVIELDKNKQATIENVVQLMEEEANAGTRLFIIDHLHYFKMEEDSNRNVEIENIMHDINEVCRKHNVAVFLVAHYRKLNNGEANNDSFKDSSAIKQVANVIIHIRRDYELGITKFSFGKIRGPIVAKDIEAKFDVKTFQYDFMEF